MDARSSEVLVEYEMHYSPQEGYRDSLSMSPTRSSAGPLATILAHTEALSKAAHDFCARSLAQCSLRLLLRSEAQPLQPSPAMEASPSTEEAFSTLTLEELKSTLAAIKVLKKYLSPEAELRLRDELSQRSTPQP